MVIANHNIFRELFDKIASVYFTWKYVYILALEKASPGNQHCANCIGSLPFPITLYQRRRNGGGDGGARPRNVETTGARVSFPPAIFPDIFACCSLNFRSLSICCLHTIKTSHSVGTTGRILKVKKSFPILVIYRALSPELIPVYRQSARRWREVNHAIYPAVVCHCFLPGLRLPS